MKRKPTGGKRHQSRGRRAYERDGYPIEPVVGKPSSRPTRLRGGSVSYGLVSTDFANVSLGGGKVTRSKIIRVKRSPANRDYERRGVITRGAIIETDAGEARVTSKPTDDGVVNAVLVEKA